MSDIKKIKDDFLLKLKDNLDLNQVNQIKTDLFGKNGLISLQFKKLKINLNLSIDKLVSGVNLLRLKNNPIDLNIKDIKKILLNFN